MISSLAGLAAFGNKKAPGWEPGAKSPPLGWGGADLGESPPDSLGGDRTQGQFLQGHSRAEVKNTPSVVIISGCLSRPAHAGCSPRHIEDSTPWESQPTPRSPLPRIATLLSMKTWERSSDFKTEFLHGQPGTRQFQQQSPSDQRSKSPFWRARSVTSCRPCPCARRAWCWRRRRIVRRQGPRRGNQAAPRWTGSVSPADVLTAMPAKRMRVPAAGIAAMMTTGLASAARACLTLKRGTNCIPH